MKDNIINEHKTIKQDNLKNKDELNDLNTPKDDHKKRNKLK